ncbi:DNA-binding domain-containing protein [Odoribacter lunatus]|uniref:DNA-binding domain-containing protein n=1 Tax=Odoribacter lunatus TaxID=2941335 RepID=UPI00203B3B7E|nr:DNA-binding domain-containing protein [Odoribacter lunatus]
MAKQYFWQGWLLDNPLTEDPNDFTLKVKAGNMVTVGDIAKALQEEGTEFQLETLIDILNRGDRIIRNKLLAGFSVGTGVFYAYPSVSGVWYDKNETFDEKKHKVSVNFQLSAALREGIKQVGVEVLGVSSAGPEISGVTDTWTGELNGLITPDEVVTVKGRNIQIAGEDEGNGIRFIRVDDNSVIPVDMRRLTVNNPSSLSFRVPKLTPGDYHLELTTQYSAGGSLLKQARTTRFEKVLNVPEAEQN